MTMHTVPLGASSAREEPRYNPFASRARSYSLFVLLGVLGGCALGPDYQRPELMAPVQFKQVEGWKAAAPADVLERGNWWALYGDTELNALAERLQLSNQNLAAAEAQYRQARALVRGARASFYPTLSGSAGVTRAASAGFRAVRWTARPD